MRTNLTLPVCIGVVALAAGFAAVPRLEERADILLRDGDPLGALALFKEAERATRDEPQLAMQVIRLNEEAGRAAETLAGLEHYVARWPGDTAALVKLAEVAKATMNTKAEIRALERLVARKREPAYQRELLGLYRETGDVRSERLLLEAMKNSAELSAEDFGRLGAMLADTGEIESALAAYRRADDRAPAKEIETRFKLLHLLLGRGHFTEATVRATRWVLGWKNPQLAGEAALRIAQSAPAKEVVTLAHAVGGDTLNLDFSVAEILAERGYRALSFEILTDAANWTDPSSERRVKRLVSAAVAGNDARAPMAVLARLLAMNGQERSAAFLAERIAESFGYDILVPLHAALGVGVLAARPMFGIEVARFGRNENLARRILLEGQPEGVPAHEAPRWAEMMFTMLGADVAMYRIAELGKHGRLSQAMRLALEDEGHKLGIPLDAVITRFQ